MSHNESQRTIMSQNEPQRAATNHNHPQRATTNYNKQQQATTSHNKPQLRRKMNKTNKKLHSLVNALSPLNLLAAGI